MNTRAVLEDELSRGGYWGAMLQVMADDRFTFLVSEGWDAEADWDGLWNQIALDVLPGWRYDRDAALNDIEVEPYDQEDADAEQAAEAAMESFFEEGKRF